MPGYSVRAEARGQGVASSDLSPQLLKVLTALHICKLPQSTMHVDSGATNKSRQVGQFTNTESAIGEDRRH